MFVCLIGKKEVQAHPDFVYFIDSKQSDFCFFTTFDSKCEFHFFSVFFFFLLVPVGRD